MQFWAAMISKSHKVTPLCSSLDRYPLKNYVTFWLPYFKNDAEKKLQNRTKKMPYGLKIKPNQQLLNEQNMLDLDNRQE